MTKTLAAVALSLVVAALAVATPLHDVAERNDLAAILALLGAGADPNAKDGTYGWSPLHWAVFRGHTQATAALLGAGADPNMKNNAGQTAIDLAETATSSRESIIAILRRETGGRRSASIHPAQHRSDIDTGG